MHFTQYYLDCLSQASYLIGDESSGRAVVVDPRRDVSEYLTDASAAGLRITHVIETHVHADFLSGHLELAEATGAEIIYGAAADIEFAITRVSDGEKLSLGEVELEFLSTPGHTPESISIVVREHAGDAVPYGVLTGDTLFIGDVGRPDLLSSKGITADELAGQLYDSLHHKLLGLPDETTVYPAHGAGSSCGKNLSTETSSSLGEQRRTNYALAPMTRERFIEVVTEGQSTAPAYFAFDAGENRRAHDLLVREEPPRFTLDAIVEAQARGAVVLDVRSPTDFARGHLADAVNVGLDGRFAEFVGTMIDPASDIVLVADEGQAAEGRIRLARIGFDRVIGAVEGPEAMLKDHPDRTERSSRITAAALDAHRNSMADLQIVDVRKPGELGDGTIPDARSIPLSELRSRVDQLDLSKPIVVHCAGGYRSSIAASWLRSRGAIDVSDLLGGYGAWAEHNPVVR